MWHGLFEAVVSLRICLLCFYGPCITSRRALALDVSGRGAMHHVSMDRPRCKGQSDGAESGRAAT